MGVVVFFMPRVDDVGVGRGGTVHNLAPIKSKDYSAKDTFELCFPWLARVSVV